MSDARAIEAVTETMRSIVDAGIKRVSAGARAIAAPPHEVATSMEQRVNVFLYRTQVDGALRNTDPTNLLPGEVGRPALPLILHYLLTPYAPDGNDLLAHRLLGGALQALHSHERLSRRDLLDLAPWSDVAQQVEQVRIFWQPLDEKDMYSLWSVFQAPYRLSAAFEVRVVQIDSRVRGPAPVPVLERRLGDSGSGVAATVEVAELDRVVPQHGQPAPLTQEPVELHGRSLQADKVVVAIGHPALAAPVDVAPELATARMVRFKLPGSVPAGLASVWLRASSAAGDVEWTTNRLPLLVAPTITSQLPMNVVRANGRAEITLSFRPRLVGKQDTSVVVGSRVVPVHKVADNRLSATFRIENAVPGRFMLRLRIDGVDSRLVADRSAIPPAFDATQAVTVA